MKQIAIVASGSPGRIQNSHTCDNFWSVSTPELSDYENPPGQERGMTAVLILGRVSPGNLQVAMLRTLVLNKIFKSIYPSDSSTPLLINFITEERRSS